MSITCPHCGRDIQTDEELSQEVAEELNIVPVLLDPLPEGNEIIKNPDKSSEAIEKAYEAIVLLNCMINCGEQHTDYSIEIVEQAMALLGEEE